jgi:N-acetylneuraminic acid mutarotase
MRRMTPVMIFILIIIMNILDPISIIDEAIAQPAPPILQEFGQVDADGNYTINWSDESSQEVILLNNKLPVSKSRASAVWDGVDSYIFGGGHSQEYSIIRFNHTSYDSEILPVQLPKEREFASAVWDGNNAYIFGGNTYADAVKTIIKFDPATNEVTTLSKRLPGPRQETSAVWTGQYAFIFGGKKDEPTTYLDEIIRFKPSTNWIATLSTKFPSPRCGTSAVWDGHNVYIFGGYGPSGYLDEIFRFDPKTYELLKLETQLPRTLARTSAVWDGNFIYIFGGRNDDRPYDEIMRFDPRTNDLIVLPTTLPTRRYDTTAVWDQKNIYIFGGYQQGSFDDIVKVSTDKIVYTLEEYNTPNFLSPNQIYTGLSNYFKVNNNKDGTYYYRVRASDSDTSTNWSNIIKIEVIRPPSTLSIHSLPLVDSDGNYSLIWDSVLNEDNYTLDEDTTPHFLDPITVYFGPNNYTHITNQTNGIYFYRVNASNRGGSSNWSNTVNITVNLDFDDDGIFNWIDVFPHDSSQWLDYDRDGYGDNQTGINPDALPKEPTQWLDFDGDGYGDNQSGHNPDAFPYDPNEWLDTDLDGIGDNADPDDDNDGVLDVDDGFPSDRTRGEVPLDYSAGIFIMTIFFILIFAIIIAAVLIKHKRKVAELSRRIEKLEEEKEKE